MEQTFCFTLNSSAFLLHLGNDCLSVHCSHLDTRNPSLPFKQKAFFYLQCPENKRARIDIKVCRFLRTWGLRHPLASLNSKGIKFHKSKRKIIHNWSCEKIPKSHWNSDKATSFSSLVENIASSAQKVSYSKPLHNNTRGLNTMKSFLACKVISRLAV